MDDIRLVGLKHAEAILRNTRLANKVLFVDTDLNITKSYSKYLFGEVPEFAPWIEKANEMDLYLYLQPDAPFVQDGTRLQKDERLRLHESHRSFFEDKDFFDIGYEEAGSSYLERFNMAVRIINDFISRY